MPPDYGGNGGGADDGLNTVHLRGMPSNLQSGDSGSSTIRVAGQDRAAALSLYGAGVMDSMDQLGGGASVGPSRSGRVALSASTFSLADQDADGTDADHRAVSGDRNSDGDGGAGGPTSGGGGGFGAGAAIASHSELRLPAEMGAPRLRRGASVESWESAAATAVAAATVEPSAERESLLSLPAYESTGRVQRGMSSVAMMDEPPVNSSPDLFDERKSPSPTPRDPRTVRHTASARNSPSDDRASSIVLSSAEPTELSNFPAPQTRLERAISLGMSCWNCISAGCAFCSGH